MTVQRLPRLNSPKQILWLGCNLLSRELQTNSQIAASVQNTLSVQETNLSSAFYDFFSMHFFIDMLLFFKLML